MKVLLLISFAAVALAGVPSLTRIDNEPEQHFASPEEKRQYMQSMLTETDDVPAAADELNMNSRVSRGAPDENNGDMEFNPDNLPENLPENSPANEQNMKRVDRSASNEVWWWFPWDNWGGGNKPVKNRNWKNFWRGSGEEYRRRVQLPWYNNWQHGWDSSEKYYWYNCMSNPQRRRGFHFPRTTNWYHGWNTDDRYYWYNFWRRGGARNRYYFGDRYAWYNNARRVSKNMIRFRSPWYDDWGRGSEERYRYKSY